MFVKANLVSAPNLIMEARANFIFISVATIAKTKTQAVITTPIKEVEVQMLIVMCAAKTPLQVEGERPIPSIVSAVASRMHVRINVIASGRVFQKKCLDYVQSGQLALETAV